MSCAGADTFAELLREDEEPLLIYSGAENQIKKRRMKKKRKHQHKQRHIPIKFHIKQPDEPKVGDMWASTRYLSTEYMRKNILSDEYIRDWANKRPPLFVMLPGDVCFCLDTRAACDNSGWTITGWPPDITVSPSINIRGVYHGFIRNGLIM